MALIVEDGTGKADAESFISVGDADTYFGNRGNADWAALTTAQKEQNLRKATDYIGQVYRLRWAGTRTTATQSLDWPRAFVLRDDYEYVGLNGSTVIGGNYYYPANEVPVQVKNATAEMAIRAAAGELSPDIGRQTKREKVDVIEVEYMDYQTPYTVYRAVDNLLAPFLKTKGTSRPVVRV